MLFEMEHESKTELLGEKQTLYSVASLMIIYIVFSDLTIKALVS